MNQEYAESVVIGHMLADSRYMAHALLQFDAHCFGVDDNRLIFMGAQKSFEHAGHHASLVDIGKHSGLKTEDLKHRLKNHIPFKNIASYEAQLIDFGKARKLKTKLNDALQTLSPKNVNHTIGFLTDTFNDISCVNQTVRNIADEVGEIEKTILANKEDKRHLKTGFSALDGWIGGLEKGRLYCLSAMSGFGKSSFAMNIAAFVNQQSPVYFVSLEMNFDEIAQRIVCMKNEVTSYQISMGNTAKVSFSTIANTRIHVDDSSNSDIDDLIIRIKSAHLKHHYSLIVIDYLQLLSVKSSEPEYLKIDAMVRKIKLLAQSLNLPIILIAQFNKQETGKGKPSMTSLKGSSAIYQHADCVMILWDDLTDEQKEIRESKHDRRVICSIQKNRSGRSNVDVTFSFASQYFKFKEVG